MYVFKFADIGEGLHEGQVGEIYVKEGQEVKEGDSLFSVETDKVTSDIPAPTTGKIAKILIKTGETVHVGDEIFHIDDGSGAAPAVTETKEEPAEEAPEEAASVVGSIEVSNKLFSFENAFKKQPAAKKAAAPSTSKVTPSPAPSLNIANGIDLPDPSKITVTGNGEKVDFVILGAGPGGYELAANLAKSGFKVVNIEDRFAGGVCLNIGCIPTKALLKTAKVLNYIKHGNDIGLDFSPEVIKVNWTQMQKRKVDISAKLEKGVEFKVKSAKAEFVKGYGEVVDKHNVKVGERVFTTKYIVLATGSRPVVLPLPGFEKGYKDGNIIDSTGALSLEKLPKSMAIIGGGVIGVEFATLFNELGVKVTILEGAPNILGPMDGEIKKLMEKHIKEMGIDVKTSVKVIKYDNGSVVYEENGKEVNLKIDKLLVSVGRRPNNMDLDKKIGLKLGKRGEVVVNDIMQTSIPNIFAIGDVIGHAMLAHTAYKHAFVLTNAFNGKYKPYDRKKIPGCIYIYPEISSIGYTEEELKAENIPYKVSSWKNMAIGRALAENDTLGFTKLLFDPKYGTILGAHIINGASSEMISEIGAVMELEGTVHELASTVHPHPSVSEGIWEAAVRAVEMLEKGAK